MKPTSLEKKRLAKHIIAVVAGKGGVGKSAVTVNLALALQKKGYFVGILDADLYGPSLQKMLPMEEAPQEYEKETNTLLPAVGKGIKMISMAYFRGENEASMVRAPIANALITQFLHNVHWGDLDYLLLDFPPGTGDIQLTILQEAVLSGAIIVTTPQEVALLDVHKATQMLEKMHVPILGVVENMSYFSDPKTGEKHFVFGKGGGRRFAEGRGLPFLGEIPIDPHLSLCLDEGKSIFENYPDSISASSFLSLLDIMQEHLIAMQTQVGNVVSDFELIWKDI
ncbi:MAG: Mrp/NBP35 family ATP-binding protein [Chlamydiae bacterium]|jgi:ATP-binding protein involved in chromosome partitioning|nr:Mrp/NBP35 family ATP-binding protein [Chlamydiota bacterium]